MITIRVPNHEHVSLDSLRARLIRRDALPPFSAERLALGIDFGRRIAADAGARAVPALRALAFWLRAAELYRLKEEFEALDGRGVVSVARGVVLHFPPTNVDTLFVYSWLLAMLAGNRNVIRLSSRAGGQAETLLRLLNDAITAADVRLRDETLVIQYERDAAVTEALSAACDVRVIWGGDASVSAIRAVPLPPRATELAFPDRYSFAALRAAAVNTLDAPSLELLADRLFNDTFWFDQMGCSSPRVVFWVGEASESVRAAETLWRALSVRVAARGYSVETGTAIAKLTFAHRAVLDGVADRFTWHTNELLVASAPSQAPFSREHPGGGTLLERCASSLDEIVAHLTPRDQTLAHFGFTQEELVTWVRAAGARSFDRLVPLGDALRFDRFWDGYDLLSQFTRRIRVVASTELR